MRTSTISTPGDGDALGHLGGELVRDDVGRAAQREARLGRIVVRMRGRNMPQRRLGLHAHEIQVVIDGVERSRGIGHLPDDDRGDLDGIAVGVVDLQMVRLEVPDPDADVAPVGEGQDPGQAGAAHGAGVAAEEPHDPGLAGLHDDERGQDQNGDDARHDGDAVVRAL